MIYHANTNHNKVIVAILISNSRNQYNETSWDIKEHHVITNGLIPQEEIIILKI